MGLLQMWESFLGDIMEDVFKSRDILSVCYDVSSYRDKLIRLFNQCDECKATKVSDELKEEFLNLSNDLYDRLEEVNTIIEKLLEMSCID